MLNREAKCSAFGVYLIKLKSCFQQRKDILLILAQVCVKRVTLQLEVHLTLISERCLYFLLGNSLPKAAYMAYSSP